MTKETQAESSAKAPTVIYLRSKNVVDPKASNDDLPRKGAPIGAIAYLYTEGFLEVAYALQNPKDKWSRARSREIVMKRLELKRESCTKQIRYEANHVESFDTVPKYFRIPLEEREEAYRPYDILERIVEAHQENEIRVPERLIRTIKRMMVENDFRVQKLEALAKKRSTAPAASSSTETVLEVAAAVASAQ